MAGLFMTPSNSLLLVCSLGILLLQQQLDSVDGTMEMSGVVLKRSSSSSTSSISGMGGNDRDSSSSSSLSSSRRSGSVNGVISTRIIDSFNLTKRHNCRDLCNPPHKQSSICPFRCQHRLKESRTEYSDKNRALTKRQTAPSDEQPAKEKSMDDRFTEERPTEKRPAEERPVEEKRPAEEEESAEPTKTIAIEAVVRAMKKNTLDAVVSWEWPLSSTDQKPYNFIVHWARVTCNADESFAHCDDPDMYHANTVWSWESKSNFTLPNVTYNSRYWAEVEYDRVTSHKVWFTTRGCRNPADKYFKRCVDSSSFRSTSSVSRTDKNPLLHINVSCLHFDTSSQTGKAFLEWNSDEDSNNGSSRENTILIRYQTPKGPHLEIHHTKVGQFYFDLVPNRIYEIVVKSHDNIKETIYETLNLNISRDHVGQPCLRQDAEAYMVPTLSKESGHLLPSIVIAGVAMVVVILVCLLAVHRCRGIKRKLLKKTLLAKSNSYKSPPGAVPHHAKEEQLQMVMKDEWELNPEHVAIGGEVGQGAFGLVMTGIYQNAQVAIKVLKGEVLPSYKEELLREIALMKRIGKHPNIVSLVGAVTTQEPIALIMEYMPYGNLQTFLQKCRSEGEVRQTEKGMEVDYSPLDELTGTKETWIITSTDMLSFARQIAVAMEFLTDRKYVHRDLAARNVLVGQNKVVKLCDFGLARVVYNGDQYCKLTNGRLPLKWMALESIRDRIFTAQSDVWSYGVLLWEIATLGMTPYPDIAIAELFRHLIEGYRMEQPDNCSAELYAIMSECWCEVPSQRPTFGAIRSQLEALLSQHRNYLDLDCVEPPPTRTGCPVGAASPVDTELLPAVLTRTSRTRPTSGISLDCFSSTGGATAAAAHALTTTSNRMSDAGGSDYRYPREIRSLATSGGREPRTIQDNEDMFVQLLYSN